jgi:hypothetical protein
MQKLSSKNSIIMLATVEGKCATFLFKNIISGIFHNDGKHVLVPLQSPLATTTTTTTNATGHRIVDEY